MRRIRVLLVDDHKLFRAGLRSLLQALEDVEVVAQADDGREALRLVEAHGPDVVLLDIMMPGLNGLDAVARMARASARTRVIILSMSAQEESVLRALRAGAVGYLVKSADPAELELAIRAVMRGERFLSSAVSEHVVAAWLNAPDRELTPMERLTARQREVLQLVAEGHTSKEIARKLDISTRSAETYRTDLMGILKIHDIAGLTRYAIRVGLVSPDN